MAASFPSSLKSFTNPTPANNLNSPSHAQQHIDVNNEVVAIETELGTTPKGTYADVKTRLADAVYKIGAQTVAGVKTFSSFPVTPSSAPTANFEVANKKYVDDHISFFVPTNIQVFTSSGTWAKPAGISIAYVKAWGGGGGGGGTTGGAGTGGGGGGGAYSEGMIAVTTNVAITVGIAGVAGSSGTTGGNGGSSTFVGTTTLTAGGGAGGLTKGVTGITGGAGGTASGGSVNLPGIAGDDGSTSNSTVVASGGIASFAGGFPGVTKGNGMDGGAGKGYGVGGGPGQGVSNQQGGAGSQGLVIVYY